MAGSASRTARRGSPRSTHTPDMLLEVRPPTAFRDIGAISASNLPCGDA